MAAKLDKKNKITTKLIVWKQPCKKGYPLKVRITKSRKTKYINLKHYLSKSEINKFISQKNEELLSSYPKYDEVMSKYNSILAKLDVKSNEPEILSDLTFSSFLENNIKTLEARGKWGYAQKTKSVKLHLNKFTNNSDIKFEEIDIDFLKELQTYCIQINLAGITQKGYFDKIKSLINSAIKEDKYLPKKHPFIAFEPEPYEILRKNLDKSEFELIDSIKINNGGKTGNNVPENIFETAQKFKFQYYALGMRVSDLILLTWGDIKKEGTRIEYEMFKTKRTMNFLITNELYLILYLRLPDIFQNQLLYSIDVHLGEEEDQLAENQSKDLIGDLIFEKVIEFMKPVLENISSNEDFSDKYIFEMIPYGIEGKKLYSKIQQATSHYNADLKDLQAYFGINTKLVTHTPRHTFAIQAIVDEKLDIYQLSKALNHSSVKVTESYLRGFESTELDGSLKNFYDSKYETVEDKVEKRKIKSSFPALKEMNNKEKKELLKLLQKELMK